MKPVYHLIIGCALLGGAIFGHTNSLQAQGTKKPIPTIRLGAEWSQLESYANYYEEEGELPCLRVYDETHRYQLKEKITDANGVEWLTDGYAFLREDLDKGIIYIRYKNKLLTTPEMVLFDYNLNVGDSAMMFDVMGEIIKCRDEEPQTYQRYIKEYRPTLERIETRNIGGIERRVYVFSDFLGPIDPNEIDGNNVGEQEKSIEWIEGIGYNFGFVYRDDPKFFGRSFVTFVALCYTSPEGETIHLHPGYKECTIQGVRSIEARPEAIGVKVMRAGDSLILTVEDGATHRLTVYSMEGMQLIPEETFVGSYRLPISRCAEEGQTILLRIDNHSIPYIL